MCQGVACLIGGFDAEDGRRVLEWLLAGVVDQGSESESGEVRLGRTPSAAAEGLRKGLLLIFRSR